MAGPPQPHPPYDGSRHDWCRRRTEGRTVPCGVYTLASLALLHTRSTALARLCSTPVHPCMQAQVAAGTKGLPSWRLPFTLHPSLTILLCFS